MNWMLIIIYCVLTLVLSYFMITIMIYLSLPKRNYLEYSAKHAFITGGSKGIGKSLAKALIRRGCSVSLAARNIDSLVKVCSELNLFSLKEGLETRADWYRLNVTDGYDAIRSVIDSAEQKLGPIDILINNAGSVVQGKFENLDVAAFREQMELNYLSAVYASRAVVERMKMSKSGHIAFVSSAAGQCAIWGYSAYSPSKFALRGFAEALHMELLPYNVGVSILYPPNTNTEGFQKELREMPDEVRQISGTAGLFEPDEVAERLLDDISRGQFSTTVGFEGWMLNILAAGCAPEKSFLRALSQIFLAGIFRGVMLIYNGHFNRVIKKCQFKKQAKAINAKLD